MFNSAWKQGFLKSFLRKNPRRAAFWFELAARRGHADAQYLLSKSYFLGKGVRRNLERAWVHSRATVQRNFSFG